MIEISHGTLWNYSRNVKSLETHMEELSDNKTRVLHSVEEATNKTEVIEDDVVSGLLAWMLSLKRRTGFLRTKTRQRRGAS
uniref:Uncharacterized protein n=1 Tax=Salix viminalis TaxID=40686 RepID=A0A6N2LGX8_SALVM